MFSEHPKGSFFKSLFKQWEENLKARKERKKARRRESASSVDEKSKGYGQKNEKEKRVRGWIIALAAIMAVAIPCYQLFHVMPYVSELKADLAIAKQENEELQQRLKEYVEADSIRALYTIDKVQRYYGLRSSPR